jgi:16S rRNA (uracil1498-N3)-methyltransferase
VTPPLFLVPELGAAHAIVLTGAEAHHAATVKRLAVGEQILLSDGRGGVAEARVSRLAADRVECEVLSRRSLAPPRPRLVVVQALPKGERAELAVESLTELGVDEIVPWSASRSITLWKGERAGRGVAKWRRTALEAAKQSRRAWIPEIAELADTHQVARRIADGQLALLLHEDATEPLAQLTAGADGLGRLDQSVDRELLLVVGPEGGLSPEELELFTGRGGRPVRLGPEVLRTSTAGAAALAVLSVAVGRWR